MGLVLLGESRGEIREEEGEGRGRGEGGGRALQPVVWLPGTCWLTLGGERESGR